MIQKRQPWQSYIETAFNVQRRMADWDFAQATTWAELLAVHERWVVNYNYQSHWAHRQRADGRRSPANVLGWVSGRRTPGGVAPHLLSHPLRPPAGSCRLCPLPPLAAVCRARPVG